LKLLCLGDIVGAPGRGLLAQKLPAYRAAQRIDLVIANVENATEGSGIGAAAYKALRAAGIDVCTTGDHVYKRADVLTLFEREPDRILRPLNYPAGAAGRGLTTVATAGGVEVAVINLQGRVFMDPSDDPFRTLTEALASLTARVIVVDFHAEATSEKRAMAWFCDGKVSALFGTHTHVPTADEEVLPRGTAYVTDLGMCGAYHSVIGRKTESVLKNFTTKMYAPFSVATRDVRACGVLIEIDEGSGRAKTIERITLKPDEE
jgi:metallophosphoesterase (TIGR00282 family)